MKDINAYAFLFFIDLEMLTTDQTKVSLLRRCVASVHF